MLRSPTIPATTVAPFYASAFVLWFALLPAAVFGQTWVKQTPREAHDIPGTTGQWVDFPTVQLQSGMQYAAHSTGTIKTEGSTSNFADAHYYNSFLPSGIAQVGLQVKYDATQFAFLQVRSPALPSGSNDYVDRLASAGTPLSFRFFDSEEFPGSKPYYGDNSGVIHVEVAQATPQLVVQYDTLYFGDVDFRSPLTLLDSIESIGTDPFIVDRVYITGSPDFTMASAERGVASFQLAEQMTNSFGVQYAPTTLGAAQAILHVVSSSAFLGVDKDRQIVLIGIGHGPIVQVVTDTIHFGLVPVNTSHTKPGRFANVGDRDAQISGVTFFGSSTAFSSSDAKTIPAGATVDVNVDFLPTSPGYYITHGVLTLDNGWKSIGFYADGSTASGVSELTPDTLFFGGVVVGSSRTLPAFLRNTGDVDFAVVSYGLANSIDFSVNARSVYSLPVGETERYDVTFTPQSKTGLPHVGYLTVNFGDGQASKTVVLIGYDHDPVSGHVRIKRNYWALPNTSITITQELTSSVAEAVDSVHRFIETIGYNPDILDLMSVDRGELLSTEWTLVPSTLSRGYVQIIANSLGAALTGPGELLRLTFFVHSDAPFWDTSSFPQTNLSFGTGGEPLMTADAGLLRIRSACTPTAVISASAHTAILEHSSEGLRDEVRYAIGQEVPVGASVSLKLYNSLGDLVSVLAEGPQAPGEYRATIDRYRLTSGLYTLVLEAGGTRDVRRLILAR